SRRRGEPPSSRSTAPRSCWPLAWSRSRIAWWRRSGSGSTHCSGVAAHRRRRVRHEPREHAATVRVRRSPGRARGGRDASTVGLGVAPVSAAPVLVTDAPSNASLAVVRSLGRRGLRVGVCAFADEFNLASYSRWAAESLMLPSPSRDAAGFINALIKLL